MEKRNRIVDVGRSRIIELRPEEYRELIDRINNMEKENRKLKIKLESRKLEDGFIVNKGVVNKETIMKGAYREILKEHYREKSAKNIYDMCVREGFKGNYDTVRRWVLIIEIEDMYDKGLTTQEMFTRLKARSPKSRLHIETVEQYLKEILKRRLEEAQKKEIEEMVANKVPLSNILSAMKDKYPESDLKIENIRVILVNFMRKRRGATDGK